MTYYIPHKQPDGSYKLETVVIHIWRNPLRWLREFRQGVQLPQTTANYHDTMAEYTAQKAGAGHNLLTKRPDTKNRQAEAQRSRSNYEDGMPSDIETLDDGTRIMF